MNNPRPNILLILTDQQRFDTLSCYGSSFTSTPAIDRLAATGVRFDRAYTTNAICAPSRTSLFSGLQVSRHGVWSTGVNVPTDLPLLSHHLGQAGYRTHYIGKTHFQAYMLGADRSLESIYEWPSVYPQFSGPYYGFDSLETALGHTTFGLAGHYGAWVRSQVTEDEFVSFCRATSRSTFDFCCDAQDWELPVKLHNSVWTADRVTAFMRNHDRGKPFLVCAGFQDPHPPLALPKDFTNRVDPKCVPLPSYQEGELDDKPGYFDEAHCGQFQNSSMCGEYPLVGPEGSAPDFRRVSEHDASEARAYYYSMVRLIDENVGSILDCLDETGLADDTVVIFTTDHGELLGDHGLWEKGPFHYECLIRIPLIIRWPNCPYSGHTRAIASLVDVTPTILDMLQIQPAGVLDGRSLRPVLSGDAGPREHVLIETVDDPRKLRLKTVVTVDHKLTWYAGQDFGELYDLRTDPAERVNLWDASEMASLKARLLSSILGDLEVLEARMPRTCFA